MGQGTEEKRAEGNARELLERLKSEVFDDSGEELARGLGRTAEEIEAWLDGSEEIDEDAEMKIHGLAQERLGDGE